MINVKSIIKPRVLFVLGPPGSGKGTQSELISKKFRMFHISAGELLREEMAKEISFHKNIINEYILSGRIVPVEITCELIKNKINKTKIDKNQLLYLIDGFPRNRNNLEGWLNVTRNEIDIIGTLVVECTFDAISKRLELRNRSDDDKEILLKRMKIYEATKEIYPLLKSIAPFIEINGDDSANNVFRIIDNKIKYLI